VPVLADVISRPDFMSTLLAEAEFPTAPLELQVQIGWLAMLCATLLVVWAWARSESLRRAFFAREDPRLFALMRIGLGLITIQNFWNLNMHWRMLWSDEGMFTAAEAHKRLGRSALTGWSEIDGFFDHWALVKFFWGKYSLLYIHSEPNFVIGYLVVLFTVLLLFTIGFRTRVTAVVAMLLINSLYNRNAVYLEGHDTVFRCMWFMILFARTGEAWSVDNWIRRRREARLAASLGNVGLGGGASVPFDWLLWCDRAGHWVWGGLYAWWFCAIVEYSPRIVFMIVLAGLTLAAVVGIFEREHRRAQAQAGTLAVPEQVRFRLIPGWARYLFILQLVALYMATGLFKTGSVWKKGDALYYALNMDHFFRFEVATQWVSLYLATNVFRLMTLVTLYWEKLFGLVLIGLILRWRHMHRDAPWYRAMEAVWWRRWLGRISLLGAYLACYRVAMLAYPWCIELQKDKTPTPAEPGLAVIHTVFAGVLPALFVAWWVLGRWPIPIGKLFARLAPRRAARFADAKIDQELVRKWVFGRRIWLGIGVLFHGMLIATMNIGMFPVIMMWFYPAFFEAKPFLIAARWLRDRWRRRKLTRILAPRVLDDALSEAPGVLETSEQSLRRDPTGPWWLNPWRLVVGAASLLRVRGRSALRTTVERGRVRGGRIPDVVVLAIIAAAVVLVTLRGLEANTEEPGAAKVVTDPAAHKAETEQRKERLEQLGDAGHWWAYAGIGLAAIAHFRRRPEPDQLPEDRQKNVSGAGEGEPLAEPQLIGGTLMRTIVLGFAIYHCAAIGATFIPRYSVTQAWRADASKVFGNYVNGTNLGQSWKMFAPNPPRGNTFMQTVVIDTDGNSFQVGKDHYNERPYVFWYNDRERKMHRRMIGKSRWYLRYWGEYHCRDWALNNDGQLPKEVRMYKLNTPIPAPDELVKSGKPSDPRKRRLKSELVETHACDAEVVTPEMKRRRGWPLTDEDQAQLEAEATQAQATAAAKRIQWDARKEFGGKAEEARLPTPIAASPEGDDE
jgi:hypothetical protein